jgi:hypothetical protein
VKLSWAGKSELSWAGLRATAGRAQCNSVIFHFPFELIQFDFKSNLNF